MFSPDPETLPLLRTNLYRTSITLDVVLRAHLLDGSARVRARSSTAIRISLEPKGDSPRFPAPIELGDSHPYALGHMEYGFYVR